MEWQACSLMQVAMKADLTNAINDVSSTDVNQCFSDVSNRAGKNFSS